MQKLPLRIRLMLVTSAVLIICCLAIYICVLNSAIMKLDAIQAGVLSFSAGADTDIVMNISMEDLFPEISQIIGDAKSDFIRQSVIITILVVLFGSLITFFTSKFALYPIRKLEAVVADTTEHDIHEPLPLPEAKDEVRKLTEAFNRMRARHDSAFTAQKQFSANAAHELRTPLAIMQTSLEVFKKSEDKTPETYEAALDTTLNQIDRLNHLVNTLLSFQSMHQAALEDRICISELGEEICCDLETVAVQRDIVLQCEASSQRHIQGNETLIYQAIFNLVENAIKYNRPSGTVRLKLEDTPEGVLTTVADTGIGIPKEQWTKIFDAFYRVDKSRSRESGGSGLGLAMVKEIADLHCGKVWVADSSSEGTTICLMLP